MNNNGTLLAGSPWAVAALTLCMPYFIISLFMLCVACVDWNRHPYRRFYNSGDTSVYSNEFLINKPEKLSVRTSWRSSRRKGPMFRSTPVYPQGQQPVYQQIPAEYQTPDASMRRRVTINPPTPQEQLEQARALELQKTPAELLDEVKRMQQNSGTPGGSWNGLSSPGQPPPGLPTPPGPRPERPAWMSEAEALALRRNASSGL